MQINAIYIKKLLSLYLSVSIVFIEVTVYFIRFFKKQCLYALYSLIAHIKYNPDGEASGFLFLQKRGAFYRIAFAGAGMSSQFVIT